MVVLDTKRYWLIREAKVNGRWDKEQTGSIRVLNEYDDRMLPFPVVKRQVMDDFAKDARTLAESNSVTTAEYRILPHDPSLFGLSAFGLP